MGRLSLQTTGRSFMFPKSSSSHGDLKKHGTCWRDNKPKDNQPRRFLEPFDENFLTGVLEEPREAFCLISCLETWKNPCEGHYWLQVINFRILREEDQDKKLDHNSGFCESRIWSSAFQNLLVRIPSNTVLECGHGM